MTSPTVTSYAPDHVSPPGSSLKELLDERGISQSELATRMGRPRKTISEIATGKAAITHETALQLELVTGVSAEFWNARERAYRAYLAAVAERARLARQAKWCVRFPIRDMVKLGWLTHDTDKASLAHQLLSFLGVVSSDQWDTLFADYTFDPPHSRSHVPDAFALGAWLRKGELEAQSISTQPFDNERFLTVLHAARKLTSVRLETIVPTLQTLGAAAGVAVVLVPELPKTFVAGATRWVTADKAIIQLSPRHRTTDQFWTAFYHQAAHILLHRKKTVFLEYAKGPHTTVDSEADDWAADFLLMTA